MRRKNTPPSKKMDYYKILGVEKNASPDEIKKAYRKLAHKYHPDKENGDEKKFKEINEAYQTLSSEEKRKNYDNFGTAEPGGFGGFNWQGQGGSSGFNVDFDSEDLGDIFGDFFGFGRGRKARKNANKGNDINIDIELSLEETLKEIKKNISLYKLSTCKRCSGTGGEPGTALNECFSCGGTGEVQQIKQTFLGSYTVKTICPQCNGIGKNPKVPCNVCRGEGRIKEEEEITLTIPAGVDTNQVLKFAKMGEAGRRGISSGNLYVRIHIKKNPIFEREGDNLFASLPIPYSTAMLGGEVEITTLEKTKIILNVPPRTESGKTLRISKKGIPRFLGKERGDLYVSLNIDIPKKITKEQKRVLEELSKEGL